MSWNLYAQADAGQVAKKLEEAKTAALGSQPFEAWDADVEEQMGVAFEAAVLLAKAVEEGTPVNLNLTGHCRRGDTDVPLISLGISSSGKRAKRGKS